MFFSFTFFSARVPVPGLAQDVATLYSPGLRGRTRAGAAPWPEVPNLYCSGRVGGGQRAALVGNVREWAKRLHVCGSCMRRRCVAVTLFVVGPLCTRRQCQTWPASDVPHAETAGGSAVEKRKKEYTATRTQHAGKPTELVKTGDDALERFPAAEHHQWPPTVRHPTYRKKEP